MFVGSLSPSISKKKTGGASSPPRRHRYLQIALGRVGGKTYKELAHRLVLWAMEGPPTDPAMEAMHTCDNTQCLNPHHLVWGSHKENMAGSKGGGNARAQTRRDAWLQQLNTAAAPEGVGQS
jgi:hypothetical protein